MIRRSLRPHFSGVTAAARGLGITPQSVSNFVRGGTTIRPAYAKRIRVIDEN